MNVLIGVQDSIIWLQRSGLTVWFVIESAVFDLYFFLGLSYGSIKLLKSHLELKDYIISVFETLDSLIGVYFNGSFWKGFALESEDDLFAFILCYI